MIRSIFFELCKCIATHYSFFVFSVPTELSVLSMPVRPAKGGAGRRAGRHCAYFTRQSVTPGRISPDVLSLSRPPAGRRYLSAGSFPCRQPLLSGSGRRMDSRLLPRLPVLLRLPRCGETTWSPFPGMTANHISNRTEDGLSNSTRLG